MLDHCNIRSLDYRLNTLFIRSCANSWWIRANGANKAVLRRWVGVIQRNLDDIVGERVPKETVDFNRLEHLFNEHVV